MSKQNTEPQNKQQSEWTYEYTDFGTKYHELGHGDDDHDTTVIVYSQVIMKKERLALKEEFFRITNTDFSRFALDAIWDKFDREIRNTEQIGPAVSEYFTKQWEVKYNEASNFQERLNRF